MRLGVVLLYTRDNATWHEVPWLPAGSPLNRQINREAKQWAANHEQMATSVDPHLTPK
jgi:hypothetical protein